MKTIGLIAVMMLVACGGRSDLGIDPSSDPPPTTADDAAPDARKCGWECIDGMGLVDTCTGGTVGIRCDLADAAPDAAPDACTGWICTVAGGLYDTCSGTRIMCPQAPPVCSAVTNCMYCAGALVCPP